MLVWGLAARAPSSPPASDPLPPEMKPYTETIPGTEIHFDLAPIPGGTFNMGSPPGEAGRSEDEGPAHRVTVHPFWMGKTEVTWDEYDVFAFKAGITRTVGSPVEETAAEKLADAVTHPTPPYTDETFGFGRKGQPAINITHHAAMEYTRWLSALTGKTYRLPTEAEWEYACRAGASTPFFFGGDATELGDYSWDADNSGARPHPVGQKKPNPWGLYDILGNVGEWVLDKYDKDYYGSFKPDVPALLPVLIPGRERFPNVVRGGSWDDKAGRVRCAARLASSADWMSQDPQRPQSIWWLTDALFVGFRIVRPLEEQENLKGIRSQVKKFDF
ncbi:MAG: sulfatase-modifying factor protein [Acidobacteria bacterium]|nr:MAG: sulfatase-modifying factor protein [Acidobacteriota bacterium]